MSATNLVKQISLFRWDAEHQEYYRTYFELKEFSPFRITVGTKAGTRIIESQYDMSKLLRGDFLLTGYIYKRPGEKIAKLYPLPDESDQFSEPVVRYAKANRRQAIFTDKNIVDRQAVLAQLQNTIEEAKQIRKETYQAQYNFKKSFERNIPATAGSSPSASSPPAMSTVNSVSTEKQKSRKDRKKEQKTKEISIEKESEKIEPKGNRKKRVDKILRTFFD